MKQPKNTLSLDMRCDEGRAVVELDLSIFLLPAERAWLFSLLEGAQEGRKVDFSVESTPIGEQIIRFTLAATVRANMMETAEAVQ